jgi:hypothetical protein
MLARSRKRGTQHDSPQPPLERPIASEAITAPESASEAFLDRVMSRLDVPGHTQRQPIEDRVALRVDILDPSGYTHVGFTPIRQRPG